MKTNLILVEGLPSSGKSTTAEMISEILNQNNITNDFYYEGKADHPADYDGVAFFDEKQFSNLIDAFEDHKNLINNLTLKKDNGYLIDYKTGLKKYENKLPKDLRNVFFQNDVYELPLSIHMELVKNKWIEFVNQAKEQEKVYIFDCPFIQNPVTVTMIRDNVNPEPIFEYIKELENQIKQLNPVLFYISQMDIEYSFKRSIENRSKEWLEFFINYYTKQNYGKEFNYTGLEGVISILKNRQKLERMILDKLDIEVHVIDNSDFDINKHKKRVKEILSDSILKK